MSKRVTRTFTVLMTLAIIFILAVTLFFAGYNYVREQDKRIKFLQERVSEASAKGEKLFNSETPDAVEITIERSYSSSEIADELYKKGLIKNKTMFKLLSKINGFDGDYQAGNHYLTPELSYDEIMYMLTIIPEPIKITFVEGMTYKQMQEKMIEAGLKINVERMDSLVEKPNLFIDYDFVRELAKHKDRKWKLQGYLWPDTYQFDSQMDEETILRVFLSNTEHKLQEGEEYKERAEERGLTMDQVVTLASLVQAESNVAQMNKIARVFLNRIDNEMPLQSCASINFLRMEEGQDPIPWAATSDIEKYKDNLYNTYSNAGLPPGPINNPGIIAIESVLWPATERTWSGASSYLYFCADGKGNNVFSFTLEEQEENIQKYQAEWNQ